MVAKLPIDFIPLNNSLSLDTMNITTKKALGIVGNLCTSHGYCFSDK